jgi:hypothetical protein
MLTGVTLTGADDSIDPDALIELSDRFPFVEWGILIGSRGGTERFPSEQWVRSLVDKVQRGLGRVRLSAHLCGQALRRAMVGTSPLPLRLMSAFGRIQLNFHGRELESNLRTNLGWNLRDITPNEKCAVIVQLDGANDHLLDDLKDVPGLRAHGLYDRSHGAGVVPGEWPKPNPNWEIGFAGGLGPENVLSELSRIRQVAGQQGFWIDMETKLRSPRTVIAAGIPDPEGDVADPEGDVFDLRLCRAVLEETQREIGR